MKDQFHCHVYIIGFQKNGGAQLSFYQEALLHSRIFPKSKVYFFVSGDLSSIEETNTPPNFFVVEHRSNKNFNLIRLFYYLYFLFFQIKKLKRKSKSISISYTTPAVSIISTSLGIILGIKDRRYRVGGLLFSLSHRTKNDLFASIYGYLVDLYITLFSNSITFVCDANKEFYKKAYFFIKYKKLSVIYSPCCDKKILKFYSKTKDIKSYLKQIDNFKFIGQKIILTIVNDKKRKGFPIFYELANKLSHRKDLLFIHLGSRTVKNPRALTNNLLVIPHSNYFAHWIESSHITVLFSTYPEGLPQVIAQALSLSIPVLTFEHIGVNDLILNNFNGCIVNNKSSIEDLELTLLDMLNDNNYKEYKFNAGVLSKHIFKRHSAKRLYKDLDKLFKN